MTAPLSPVPGTGFLFRQPLALPPFLGKILSKVLCSTADAAASCAINPVVLQDEILADEKVTSGTAFLCGVPGSRTDTPESILPMGDQLQMGRIYAVPDTAEMIKHFSKGFRTVPHFPENFMGNPAPVGNGEFSITGIEFPAAPFPATGVPVDDGTRKQLLSQGKVAKDTSSLATCVAPTTESARFSRSRAIQAHALNIPGSRMKERK